jgi:hypothetical protein
VGALVHGVLASLAVHILKEEFQRNRRHRPRLCGRDVRPHQLHEIIEQQAEGALKYRPLWGGFQG